MKKPVKIALSALAIVIVAGASIYQYIKPLAVETQTLTNGEAEIYFYEQGYVKTGEDIDVYPVVSGEILSVNVAEGQKINRGDIICTIDSSELNYQKLQAESTNRGYRAQAENLDLEEKQQKDTAVYNKERLQSELNALIAQESGTNISKDEQIRLQNIIIDQSKTDLKNAKDDLAKGKILFDNGAIPKKEYEQLQNAVSKFENALKNQEQQLSIIKSGQGQTSPEYFKSMKSSLLTQIRGIDNTLNKSYTGAMKEYYSSLAAAGQSNIDQLNKKIDQCVIKAPASGEITSLSAKNSNVASPTTPIAVIHNATGKRVEVLVSTKDIDSIKIGDSVELVAKREKGDITFSGKIIDIDDKATVKLSALGIEERRVKVTVEPGTAEGITLESDFDVDVKFITYHEKNKITVPKTAVFKDSKTNKDTVWLIKKGKAAAQTVTLGIELRTDYVVESGLFAGDIIVKDANIDGLSKNARIKSK